ncbi:hypothetical protein PLICRDRAFT_104299 [Plicaturopsis crispa FD-325 SS-3]|nr:hypothetical protein PLICRDRAFT_104299 [Plicaturopsis crispa FD-325 SS-3]
MILLSRHIAPAATFCIYFLAGAGRAYTQSIANTTPSPGQPKKTGSVGQFEIIGNSLVSAQQLFLGTPDKVYIVDKTENNPTQVNGHPAWAAEFSMTSNKARGMDVVTNSFCAGGNLLGNGTWVNVGGNQAVTYGGGQANSQNGGGRYNDPDGGKSLLTPCDDDSCDWVLTAGLSTRRWYPSLETLEDGSVMILGGCQWGGYVNDANQTNPTYEFLPPRGTGTPIVSPILTATLPVNLYPITFLLPSGNVLLQSNWATAMLDYKNKKEYKLDDIPDAVRTYPASAGTVMMPLTPKNNWTATILFCGGTNLQSDRWTQDWDIATYPASNSCVQITPDVASTYSEDDPLPEGRSMANLIILPNGQILCLNGAQTGTAGYGNTSWSIGQSYADNPVLSPVIYDPTAPAGTRWSRKGLSPSTVPRLYHSGATLLPDGSVFVSGSNPNADYNTDVTYATEYRVEKFYPLYYNERRPEPRGLPANLSYGGPSFDVQLSKDDLGGNIWNAQNASVVVVRTGFSTHSINMGQRLVELDSTYTGNPDGSVVLHVSQLPPNPAILAPGPALLFVVVDGVPSIGVQIMVGSGQIGTQDILPIGSLPGSGMPQQNDQVQSSSAGLSSFARAGSGEWVVIFGVAVAFLLVA